MNTKDRRLRVEPLFGEMLSADSLPPTVSRLNRNEALLGFVSADNQREFVISPRVFSRHILLIGAIGTGKTNTFNFIVRDIDGKMTDDDVMLIFDTKGDFYKEFFTDECDVVIGNSSVFAGKTSYWNLFREIEYGGRTREEKELTAKEIAKALFEQRKNQSQPFFSSAACDIFAKVVIGKMRKFWDLPKYKVLEEELEGYLEQGADAQNAKEIETIIFRQRRRFDAYADSYNNRVLVKDMFEQYEPEDYLRILREYPDFKSAISYIGNGTSNQALGVFGELNSMISDYFVGIFGDYRSGRDVSMRELVHEKKGRKIFIEYDLSIGQVLSSIYTLMIDLGLKEALGRSRIEGNVYLIIDEFKLLPKLSHIDDALNFGRSLGIKVAAGIQNIKQLEDVYGETRGQVIAAGFSNIFAFRMTDEPSRTYVSRLFGRNYLSIQYRDDAQESQVLGREGCTVEDWQLMELKTGQAIIGLTDCRPFLFQFQEYDSRG